MKGWNGWTIVHSSRVSHVDGRPPRSSPQVAACVQGTQVEAAVGVGETAYFIRTYWSNALSPEMAEALAAHPPGTVLIHGMHPGTLVDGQSGWTPL